MLFAENTNQKNWTKRLRRGRGLVLTQTSWWLSITSFSQAKLVNLLNINKYDSWPWHQSWLATFDLCDKTGYSLLSQKNCLNLTVWVRWLTLLAPQWKNFCLEFAWKQFMTWAPNATNRWHKRCARHIAEAVNSNANSLQACELPTGRRGHGHRTAWHHNSQSFKYNVRTNKKIKRFMLFFSFTTKAQQIHHKHF